uniref:Regulator of chromosome condensation 2 n=1 Tax=Eptatretus burgeri TaxID=7764 RepID=A0A8C4X2D4_EPTBU
MPRRSRPEADGVGPDVKRQELERDVPADGQGDAGAGGRGEIEVDGQGVTGEDGREEINREHKQRSIVEGDGHAVIQGEGQEEGRGDGQGDNGGDGQAVSSSSTSLPRDMQRTRVHVLTNHGQLIICGATNWDLVGRREVPKNQVPFRNIGQNLWSPHRYSGLLRVPVSRVITGPCSAHNLLITTQGKVYSWGRGEKGQLGHGDTSRVEIPKPLEALQEQVVVDGACGRSHTLCLTEEGTVFAFGENRLGQLGLGNQTDAVPSPTQISYTGKPIVRVACGAEFSMVLDCKGGLYSFGCPEYGQLGHNSDGRFVVRSQRTEFACGLAPRRIAFFLEKTRGGQVLPVSNVLVKDMACGANHTLALDVHKRVFSWGFGGYGRLGHAEPRDEMVPRFVKALDRPGHGVARICAGFSCSLAVLDSGSLYFWGSTNTARDATMYPKAVQELCGWRVRSLSCGKSSIVITADDSTISWGPWPTYGELGYGEGRPRSSSVPQELKKLDGIYIQEVAMGFAHSLFLARDETAEDREKIEKLPEYSPRPL